MLYFSMAAMILIHFIHVLCTYTGATLERRGEGKGGPEDASATK